MPLHYTEKEARKLPTFVELRREIDFGIISGLNTAMVTAEKMWDGIPAKDTETAKSDETKRSAGYIRDIIIGLYSKREEERISSSIGPFTELNNLYIEGLAADRGTWSEEVRGEMLETPIEINIGGTPTIRPIFHIPKEIEINYEDGRSYKVAFFGARSQNPYWAQLKNDIVNICEQAKQVLLATESNPQLRSNITENIDAMLIKAGGLKELAEKMKEKNEGNN